MSISSYFDWQREFQLDNSRLPYNDEIYKKGYSDGLNAASSKKLLIEAIRLFFSQEYTGDLEEYIFKPSENKRFHKDMMFPDAPEECLKVCTAWNSLCELFDHQEEKMEVGYFINYNKGKTYVCCDPRYQEEQHRKKDGDFWIID